MSIYQLVQVQFLKTVYGFFPTTDVNLPTCSDSSQLLKTVYGRFPTTDVALLLIQIPIPENSLRILRNVDVNLSLAQTPIQRCSKTGMPF